MFNLERIGAGLPVASVIGELPDTGPLVVEAPPGTGKTTLVPPAVANKVGKTLVTAPRRVAVRAAARRLQELSLDDASLPPAAVGYAIRGEHERGELVEFATPGVLLNRLLRDPGLEGINAVIIDEVHERQLDTDLVLAMCMEVAILRDDFYLAAMSATLDAAAFAEHMGAQILSTRAETHPLEVQYAPHSGRLEGTREFYRHVAGLASEALQDDGRTLVFVPGAREVDMVVEFLRANGREATRLHGRLSSAEQDEALNGDASVVVATAVAESSITVPGVRCVVDAGLSREPRRDARGMTGLVTVSESKASANQRAGRAARLGPGAVIRAFTEPDYQHFREDAAPEIATSDLTGAALAMHAWGSPDLPLLTAPPAAAFREAENLLELLGAIEGTGTGDTATITDFGRQLARLPLDPRLGAALLSLGAGAAPTVAAIAEGISGDLTRAQPPKRQVERLAKLAPAGPPVPAGDVVGAAFPQWVAKRTGEDYLLASGTRARLASEVAGTMGTPEWLAAAEIQRTNTGSSSGSSSGAIIRTAAATTLPEDRVTEEYRATLVDGRVQGRKVKAVGAIELSSTPVQLTADQAMEALTDLSFEHFTLDDAAQQLKHRLDFLHATLGDPWPDVTQGDYGVEIGEVANGASISNVDMKTAMLRNLPWPEAAKLDELAPQRLEVPSGSHPRVDYASGRPVVRVKLQECFGLAHSPVVAGVRVQFHLLSPAGRELAVTDDLESFWNGPYVEVRKEMRGRYPKHPWPLDPWSATATAKTKARMGK